jgi:hypothetical protein
MKKYSLYKTLGTGCLLMMAVFCSCADDYQLGLSKADSTAPAAPTVTSVDNGDGQATIHYTVPSDDDMLYVVATYKNNATSTRTTKVSVYDNKITVLGFAEAGSYDVDLKSVDRSGNESTPVKVTVNPTEPPYKKIYSSIKTLPSWSGFKITWDNPTEANIIVTVLKKDSTGVFQPFTSIYSNSAAGSSSVRGFNDITEQDVKIYIRDRYDNYSEQKEFTFTPWKEEKIGKSKFKEIHLPGDMNNLAGWPLSNIWDGIYNDVGSGFFHGFDAVDCGKFITFDMGDKIQISRYVQFQRLYSTTTYSHNNIKTWKMYGCNEITEDMYNRADLADEYVSEGISEGGTKWKEWVAMQTQGWTELDDARCYRPSGRESAGNYTQEDYDYIVNGDEHEIDVAKPACRYIRILILSTWGGGAIPQISEIDFYGQIVK